MIRIIITVIIFLTLHNNLYAGEKTIIFKFFHNDKYEVYLNMQNSCMRDRSMMGAISKHLLYSHYNVERIPLEYYSIEQQDNISFYGFNITQYTITPKVKDRFKSILWTDKNDRIVKMEIFDNTNTLMFAFSGFDYIDGDSKSNRKRDHAKKSSDHNTRRGDAGAKYRFKDNIEFYKGFRHFHTTIFNNNENNSINMFDISFEDGVNRFTIFIKPSKENNTHVNKVVYGNYLYSRVIGNIEYTIYGTISFGLMEEIVNIIHENIKNIFKIASSGNILTSEIYKK